MRLISVDAFRLEEFAEPNIPKYGILSHTWEGEEAEYHDMMGASLAQIRLAARYHKIRGCARLATEDKLKYIWIDTCCINKSSSAELQEAINSMYRWYKNATICYVYLSDHEPGPLSLARCRWVTRGWTLQELIAPSKLHFYASDWSMIGSKQDDCLECARATGIDRDILSSSDHSSASIAEKMSWASKRRCTRVEDIAYSLMGLFGIHMPMLYGEGEKAFMRLQEEIIRSTFDMSIFAWVDKSADDATYCGLLAPHPSYFEPSITIESRRSFQRDQPYSMTNLGVHLHAMLCPLASESETYSVCLANIHEVDSPLEEELALHLKRISPESNQFVRIRSNEWKYYDEPMDLTKTKVEEIYVRQFPDIPSTHLTAIPKSISVHVSVVAFNGQVQTCCVLRVWPQLDWSESQSVLLTGPSRPVTRAVIWYSTSINAKDNDIRVILLSLAKPSGERYICVYDNIPIDIGEAEVEETVWRSTSSTVGVAKTVGNSPFSSDKHTHHGLIHATFIACVVNSRVVLVARVNDYLNYNTIQS